MRPSPHALRVLIIDDNDAFRAAARKLLERDGFAVVARQRDAIRGVGEARRVMPRSWRSSTSAFPISTDSRWPSGSRPLAVLPAVILISSHDGAIFGALVAGSRACGFIPKAELSARAIESLLATAG